MVEYLGFITCICHPGLHPYVAKFEICTGSEVRYTLASALLGGEWVLHFEVSTLPVFFLTGLEMLPFKKDGYNFWTWRSHKVHYIVQGQGPPMVLIHGFGASAFHWRCVRMLFLFLHVWWCPWRLMAPGVTAMFGKVMVHCVASLSSTRFKRTLLVVSPGTSQQVSAYVLTFPAFSLIFKGYGWVFGFRWFM